MGEKKRARGERQGGGATVLSHSFAWLCNAMVATTGRTSHDSMA